MFPNKIQNKTQKGFGVLEIVIGIAILSFSLLGLFMVSHISLKIIDDDTGNIQAGFLLEEGLEAVKVLRDSGWDANIKTLNAGSNYYLTFNGSTWQSTTTNTYIDNVFERKFILENVNRDINDDISVSGTPDQDTKKVTVYVSWLGRNSTTTKSISTYITNLYGN